MAPTQGIDYGTLDYAGYKTERFRVPGGWIYRTLIASNRTDAVAVHSSMVFIPEVVNEESR
jgi:hypothetical protein